MTRRLVAAACVILAALVGGVHHVLAAPEHSGQVTFGGLPVPGATVTATLGERRLVTVTDEQGVFKFADVGDGVWTIRVEMLAFAPIERQVVIGSTPGASEPSAPSPQPYDLKLLAFDEITRGLPPRPAAQTSPQPSAVSPRPASGQPGQSTAAPPAPRSGFQRAGVTASPTPAAAAPASRAAAAAPAADEPAAEAGPGAADGFLINGSVNNGAASPFAQAAAFGNNRRRSGSLYNGGLAIVFGNSTFDSRPFTFASQPTSKPSYSDLHVIGTFGGPLRFSRVLRNGPTLFVAFQHADDHNATTQPGLMPTALERTGDFSQSRDASGRPIQIHDQAGRPFPGDAIPGSLISSQAAALLSYYPLPNFSGTN
jgi:hypothetical protein